MTNLGKLTVTGGFVPLEIGDPRGWAQLWRPSPLDVGFDRTGFGAELAVRNTLLTADLSGNAKVIGRYEQELAG